MLAIGVLWLSLALFLLGWAVIGQMLASLTGNVSDFASLGAKLSTQIKSGN